MVREQKLITNNTNNEHIENNNIVTTFETGMLSEPLVDSTNNNITETHRIIPINLNINRINLIDLNELDTDSTSISNSMRIIRAEVGNQTDSAINYIELAQNQNRWVLFGLGVAFILVASFSYWLGHRRGLHIGRDNLTTILPNDRLDFRINQDSISSTNDEHKKRVLKTIWNILVGAFKFKK